MENKIEIPLANGLKIVAEQNSDPDYDRELYVGIVDGNGVWIQDLVCVQNEYRYKNDGQMDYFDNRFRVIVWADENQDDITDEFSIPLREWEELENRYDWLRPYLDRPLEDDEQENGGTSFVGETLGDFLLDGCFGDYDFTSMDELNEILKQNGIKPL